MSEQKNITALVHREHPEFAGYHVPHYVRILNVYTAPGAHRRNAPIAAVDLRLLDNEMTVRHEIPALKQVELLASSPHVVDPPSVGSICVLQFIGGLANAAVVLSCSYEGQQIAPEADKFKLAAPGVELGSAEDNAVLAAKLITELKSITDLLRKIALTGNIGTPLPAYAEVLTVTNLIDTGLDAGSITSDIKIGKTSTKV